MPQQTSILAHKSFHMVYGNKNIRERKGYSYLGVSFGVTRGWLIGLCLDIPFRLAGFNLFWKAGIFLRI